MLIAPQHDTFGLGCHAMNSTELENNPKRTAIDHVSIFTDLTEAKRHRFLLDDLLAKASDHSPIYLDVANK
jgi:endonuclease/exonuclease/phosphatase family metal-dependent hydrolase